MLLGKLDPADYHALCSMLKDFGLLHIVFTISKQFLVRQVSGPITI